MARDVGNGERELEGDVLPIDLSLQCEVADFHRFRCRELPDSQQTSQENSQFR